MRVYQFHHIGDVCLEYDPGSRPEEGKHAISLFLERSFCRVFPMVPCIVTIGFPFLVQVKIDRHGCAGDGRIAMKTGESRLRERADKAHLGAFAALKRIPESSEYGYWICREAVDGDSHTLSDNEKRPVGRRVVYWSECRESNPGYTHPKRA